MEPTNLKTLMRGKKAGGGGSAGAVVCVQCNGKRKEAKTIAVNR
jgi:hypothetical protein